MVVVVLGTVVIGGDYGARAVTGHGKRGDKIKW
jgi:hypothetical protein